MNFRGEQAGEGEMKRAMEKKNGRQSDTDKRKRFNRRK